MAEDARTLLVAGTTYRNAAPLPVWGESLRARTDAAQPLGPYRWLPAGTLFRVTHVLTTAATPVAGIEILEGPTADGPLYVLAEATAACHEAHGAPPPVPFKQGRTYRCVRPIWFWAVDRFTSSGRSRGRDVELAAGSEFRVLLTTGERSTDYVEIDVTKGDTSAVCEGMDCDTGDYRTYAAHAADCELLRPLADDLPAGVYRCVRDVTVTYRDFEKVASVSSERTLPIGTKLHVAAQVYFGENNPLLCRHFTEDGTKPTEDAPLLGSYIDLSELAGGCQYLPD